MNRRLRSSDALLLFQCRKLSISSEDLVNTKLGWRDLLMFDIFALKWETTTQSHYNGKARHPRNYGKVALSTSRRIHLDLENLSMHPLCVQFPGLRQG